MTSFGIHQVINYFGCNFFFIVLCCFFCYSIFSFLDSLLATRKKTKNNLSRLETPPYVWKKTGTAILSKVFPEHFCTVNSKEMILGCLPTVLDSVMHLNGADKFHKSTIFPDFMSFQVPNFPSFSIPSSCLPIFSSIFPTTSFPDPQ